MGDATAAANLNCPEPAHLYECAREGSFPQTHPEVLAQMEATNKGNKRKMSETKVDILSTKQKCQRNEGWTRSMEYFENIKEEKLAWADILFNSVKGGGCETKNANVIDDAKLATEENIVDEAFPPQL